MKSYKVAIVTIAAWALSGCGTNPTQQIDRLDSRINVIGVESQRELNSLRATIRALNDRLDSQTSELSRLRNKIDTFCVLTRNGEMRQLLPKGSRECNVP